MGGLGPDKKRDSLLLQHPVGQGKVIGGIRCRSLNRDNIPVDMFQLLQVRNRVIHISRRYRHACDNAAVCICGLVREIILSSRFAGAFHVTSLRVCAAHSFVCSAFVPLDLLCPLLPALPCPALQFRQTFLLIAVQPFPVGSRLLLYFHQML